MVGGMSLVSELMDGLGNLAALPGGGLTAGGIAAAVGAGAFGVWWTLVNPSRITAANRPILTTPKPGKVVLVDQAATSPLDIPLDYVPKDDRGRTPYDLVGRDAIATAVEQFYSMVCADPVLQEFFADADMTALKRHQAQFIGQLWGGPVYCSLERLAEVHQRLRISPEQYWRVAGHLMVTLTRLSVPDWICLFTLARLYQARTLIVAQG